MNGAIN